MAVHFHPLRIKEIKRETPECVSVAFDIPEQLKDAFLYKEGQNITVKKVIAGEEVRRSYSICTAPHENQLRVAIKKVDGGLFSQFANVELKAGDILDVMPPTGKFNAKLISEKTGNYLAIAAGSGITPVMSIIKHTLQSQPESKFTLVYGNRSRSSIIFFEELEALKNRYMQRFNFINILSREKTDADIFYGRIDEGKLKALDKLIMYTSFDSIYLCGPEELIHSASRYFMENNIDSKKIHFELFTTPGFIRNKKAALSTESINAGPKSNVTLKLDGRSFSFDLPYEGTSILDGALQQGADLPYACKGGVCATCRAKLIEGEVHMDVNYALESDELERGYILTCQSHPKTASIIVDFDVK